MTAATEPTLGAIVQGGPEPAAADLRAPAGDASPAVAGGDAPTETPSTPGWFRLPGMSRRGFLRTGSIGVVAAGVVGSVPGLSSLLTSAEADAPEVGGGAAAVSTAAPAAEADTSGAVQSFSARVSNLSTGEMRLFVGNQTVRVQDPELAQRLNRAAQAALASGR